MAMHSGILDLNARALFFPVRHHSPACAAAVRRLIEDIRPTSVLIEGPSDFTARISELLLPHQLPIAIYTWVANSAVTATATTGAGRRGAFYPFCVYSPEWQALLAGDAVGAKLEFMDRPWYQMAHEVSGDQRYAEPELRGSRYVARLCQKLGAPDLDALWDSLFEIEDLPLTLLWERLHHFCYALRAADGDTSPRDIHREAYMAGRIEAVLRETPGRMVVVTGGFHSYALYARLNGLPFDHEATRPAASEDTEDSSVWEEVGLALTPYSYERLDGLSGYESGMPSPGFYDRVWQARLPASAECTTPSISRSVLAETVVALRGRKQIASSADLIAALTAAEALAQLRGHAQVWRRDLVDGIIGSLVKDEMSAGGGHPLLDALHLTLRGNARGRLAEGAPQAPLVADLRRRLRQVQVDFESEPLELNLNLVEAAGLAASRTLHQARILGLIGFQRVGGTDLIGRENLTSVVEKWRLVWSPEAHASVVEASLYGTTLEAASQARLLERAAREERDAEMAALVLLDAALMGGAELSCEALERLQTLVRGESELFRLARALGHLLYLYRFDSVLGTTGLAGLGSLLRETWERGLWLLETLGGPRGADRDVVRSVSAMLDTLERCGTALQLGREEFVAVLGRIATSDHQLPVLRGAAAGALWSLGTPGAAGLDEDGPAALATFADPPLLGDYLTGLFALAREEVQRHPALLAQIDALLHAYGTEEFLEALPALRLAFTYFTPREKHHMAGALTQHWRESQVSGATEEAATAALAPLATLEVPLEVAAEALRLEARLQDTLRRFGLRPFGGKGAAA